MAQRKFTSLSIVLPAYNEEENIGEIITECISFCKKNVSDYEVVVVNDGSRDKTLHKIKLLQKNYKRNLVLVNHTQNKGYGQTVADGLRAARKDWVFFMDSDKQFDISQLKTFFSHTKSADMIVGKRLDRKDRFVRKLNAHIFNRAVRTFFHIPVSDIDCAFKLMRKSLLDAMTITSRGALINTELIHKAHELNARIVELPVHHYERKFGKPTGGNPKVIAKALKEFWTLRTALWNEEGKKEIVHVFVTALLAMVIGIAGVVWSFHHGVILSYGDAEAHLNIAKKVVTSLTPGFSQLGGVWLPLPHVLMVPFVWSNYLWRTGLAGSIVSVMCYIWSAVILYKLAFLVTKNTSASYIAPLIWILNPNALYLSTTPMSEIVLFATVASSLYFFMKWIETEGLGVLILSSVFGCAATLSRYDGWALVLLEVVAVWGVTYLRYKSFRRAEGVTLLYSFFSFFGIALWLGWNQLIFGDMLYFANSDYGSKAQQMWFYARGYLPTYHNPILSVLYYAADTWLVMGTIVSVLMILGIALFAYHTVKYKLNLFYLAGFLLLFSFAFYTISLYTGQASLILPTFAQPWYKWDLSNVRYGVQMLLPASIFIAYLASQRKLLTNIIVGLVLAGSIFLVQSNGVIAYQDGTHGLSSQTVSKGPDAAYVEAWLRTHYDKGLVLMDDYKRPVSPVESGIPMNAFINVGNKPYWQEGLDNPTIDAEWLIFQEADTDVVWTGIKNKGIIEDYYVNVYRHGNIWVFKKRDDRTDFIQKRGQNLVLDNKPYVFYGVNVYDLLSDSQNDVHTVLTNLNAEHINTIRIWGFDKNGVMTGTDFASLDYILAEAKKENIHIIVVLGNQWDDYGGRKPYVTGDENSFYTDPKAIEAYEQEISTVLNHNNSLTNIAYKDDPQIAWWELLNEPRYEGNADGKIVTNWTDEMGQYVDTIDSKHLLSLGTEGFIIQNQTNPYYETHGVDYNQICNLTVITVCTAHLYPKYFTSGISDSAVEQIMNTWQHIAETAHKPFYLGEVGYDLSSGDLSSQYAFFQTVKQISNRKNIDGALIWNYGLQDDTTFTISNQTSDDQTLLSLWTATK